MKCGMLMTALVGWAGLTAGCGNMFNQHAQMMDAMRGVMADTSARLGSEGTGQVQAGGQVINPGIEVSGSVTYSATAKYVGVAGTVQAASQGKLDRPITPDVEARANAIWRNTSLSAEQRRADVMKILQPWTDASVQAFLAKLGPAPEAK